MEEAQALPDWFHNWIRSVYKIIEQQPKPATQWPDHFNNWQGEFAESYRRAFYTYQGKKLSWKGRSKPVDPADRTHICAHITAVEFGTSKGRRNFFAKELQSKRMSKEVLAAFSGLEDGLTAAQIEDAAERMALHERFFKVPYHFVGLINGDVLYNNDVTRYTYHGNGSNRFSIGLSAEANLPGLEKNRKAKHTKGTSDFIETNRIAFRKAVTISRDAGCPIQKLTAHRCFSPQRGGDPSELYWKEVALPMVKEFDLEIDYEYKEDGGRQIPVEWDESAKYHYNGRAVA